ncbi:hypothetical protein [Agrobacterium larrymoorei]|uniref:hypothetical protein n=1 Tax=Agrobacterium larrymoorei TaxID=160699 RepID=UPI0030BA6AAC
MRIKTVTTVTALNSAGQLVEALPVRTAVAGETDIVGRPVTPVSVTEDARGVPVRYVTGKSAVNSAGQVVDSIPVSGGVVDPTIPATPTFDALVASGATPYALHAPTCLLSSFIGQATVRLRHPLTNEERDFTPRNDRRLDVSAITAWCKYAPYIVTFYDQTGNGRHATRSAAANQPRLIINDGHPYELTDGSKRFLEVPGTQAYTTGQASIAMAACFHARSAAVTAPLIFVTSTTVGSPRSAMNMTTAGQISNQSRKSAETISSVSMNIGSNKWHRAISRVNYAAGTQSITLDGVKTVGAPTWPVGNAAAVDAVRPVVYGANNNTTNPSQVTHAGVTARALFQNDLTDAQAALLDTALAACAPHDVTYYDLNSAKLVVDGNSMSAAGANNQTAWPEQMVTLPGISEKAFSKNNLAVSGQSIISMLGDVTTDVDPKFTPGVTNILIVWESGNAWPSLQGQAYVDKLWEYLDGRTAGWVKVIIAGWTEGNAARQANRYLMADLISQQYQAHGVSAFFDIRQIPETADPTDLTYRIGDNLHPTTAMNAITAVYLRDVVTRLRPVA